MRITKEAILSKLPPYQDKWVTVNDRQDVGDIIADIVKSHYLFAPYYDKFAYCFSGGTIEEICDKLCNFCKDNITYKEENEDIQTTALPTGIIERGHGDCKHYASFIGGCLSAIARETGVPIDWKYCFASYKIEQKTPYHVFVVVETPTGTVWCDPTPGAGDKQPTWVVYKKINENKIAGTARAVGRISGIPAPYTGLPASVFNQEVAAGTINLTPDQVLDVLGSNANSYKALADNFAATCQQGTTSAQVAYNTSALQQALNAVQTAPAGALPGLIGNYYLLYTAAAFGFSLNPAEGFNVGAFSKWVTIYHNNLWQQINNAVVQSGDTYLKNVIKANDIKAIKAIPALVSLITSGNITAFAASVLGAGAGTTAPLPVTPAAAPTVQPVSSFANYLPWIIGGVIVLVLLND